MRALVLLTLALLAAAAAPAAAQQRLPQRSRGEAYIDQLNRSMELQQQFRRESQQSQFEVNQLRQDLQRNSLFPRGGGVGCPVGSIGC